MDENAPYMMGSCHHLAVALHRLTGWGLAMIAGPLSGEDSVFHVFCVDPEGNAWDARGRGSISDLVDEQEAMDGCLTWPIRLDGEAAVHRLCHGGDRARLGSMSDDAVRRALPDAMGLLDGSVARVSDGEEPADPAAVGAAREGRHPMPSFDRADAMPEWAAGQGPRR